MKTMIATFLHKRLRICGMLAAFAATTGLLSAQSLVARIASEVSGSELTVIKGSQHPLANPAYDAGRMPASAPLNGITIHFSRSAAQEADLDALLAAQQDPHSSQYHQWLTSDQFATRFGMAQADLDKVSSWLEQQGFTIGSVNRSRNAIRFSGSVGQVESAFQTQMHYYTVAGERHFAPSTALSIPSAFAPVVMAVRNMNDFRPRAQHIKPQPGFTSGVSGSVFFAPPDIVTAYDVAPLTSGGVNGTGQTIAIMGQSYVNVSDIEAFQSAAGLTKKDPTLVLVPGTGSDQTVSLGDEGESDLDLEWSGSIATGANVVLVYTGSSANYGVYDSAQYAVDEMVGTIISMSYSTCEPELGATEATALESIFKQATTQGQTVMAASGDAGSTACFISNPINSGDPPLTTQELVAVNYPASSAYVTGVGGTEMTSSDIFGGSSYSTYWNSSGTAGAADDLTNSLKSYVPEVVWNDDASGCGLPSCLSATGGGASTLVTRPGWQTGVPGIPSGTFRLVPDIAFYSSPGLPGYLYCTSDTSSWNTGQTASCGSGFRASATDTSLTVAGGTSFATPIFAGMVALLNQKLNYTKGQGLINPTLYTLAANGATYAAAFHDVTSGNNDCTAGSTYCAQTTGFSAGPGYDEVTGLGSLDVAKVAAAWPTNSGGSASLISTLTSVAPTNAAPNVNTSVTFTITVASASGSTTPTGNVTLQIDGGTSCGGVAATCGGNTVAAQALASNGTLTYATSFATAGTHQVLAQYAGDATHAPSVGVGEVIIAGTSSGKGTIALAATNVTESQGTTGTSTITVTPSGGYTGTVDLTLSTTSTALANLCVGFATATNSGGSVTVSGTAAVTTQLGLDSNASDCAALVKGSGNHKLRLLRTPGSGSRADGPKPGTRGLPAGIAFAGLLLAGCLARASRKLRSLACVIALGAVGMALTACGSGSSSSTTVPDPPKGTYTITVTGTDSATSTITSSTTITLTIN
jgi:subtilase family serine protease